MIRKLRSKACGMTLRISRRPTTWKRCRLPSPACALRFTADALRTSARRPGERQSMTALRGAAAAVTGAASGIGRALALELAARGCDLALADRDEAGLQQVAAEIGKGGTRKVSTHRVDVGEPGQIQEFAQAAIAAHPGLNIVINNAGVA